MRICTLVRQSYCRENWVKITQDNTYTDQKAGKEVRNDHKPNPEKSTKRLQNKPNLVLKNKTGNTVSNPDPAHALLTRDERTVKYFSPSPVWSNKIESDPVLTRKSFENHQPYPVLTTNEKSGMFILSHEAKELLELFCLQSNAIGWRQNSSNSAFVSWDKIDTACWHCQSLISKCLFGIRGKSLLELFCHHENLINRIGQVTRTTQLD